MLQFELMALYLYMFNCVVLLDVEIRCCWICLQTSEGIMLYVAYIYIVYKTICASTLPFFLP